MLGDDGYLRGDALFVDVVLAGDGRAIGVTLIVLAVAEFVVVVVVVSVNEERS